MHIGDVYLPVTADRCIPAESDPQLCPAPRIPQHRSQLIIGHDVIGPVINQGAQEILNWMVIRYHVHGRPKPRQRDPIMAPTA